MYTYNQKETDTFLGHLIRKNSLENLTLTKYSKVKRNRKLYVSNDFIRIDSRIRTKSRTLYRAAKNRKVWRVMITHMLKRHGI